MKSIGVMAIAAPLLTPGTGGGGQSQAAGKLFTKDLWLKKMR